MGVVSILTWIRLPDGMEEQLMGTCCQRDDENELDTTKLLESALQGYSVYRNSPSHKRLKPPSKLISLAGRVKKVFLVLISVKRLDRLFSQISAA